MKTALLLVGGMVVLTSSAIGQESKRLVDSSVRVDAPYKPIIRPADFTHVINNRILG